MRGNGLLSSAHDIMSANPSRLGWQRIESRSCGGRHAKYPGKHGGLVIWRREREVFDDMTLSILDPADDPPLYVAERVGTGLCVTDRWVWMQRTILRSGEIRADLGQPFATSQGNVAPGMTVTLTAENGHWLCGWSPVGHRRAAAVTPRGGWTDGQHVDTPLNNDVVRPAL
jgi:hypothetical protein